MRYHNPQDPDWARIYEIVLEGQKTWNTRINETRENLEKRLQASIPGKEVWFSEEAVCIWFPEIYSAQARPSAKARDMHISTFFVVPEKWGSGLAGDLMNFSLLRMQKNGSKHVGLWTPTAARRASRFYDKMGWECSGKTAKLLGSDMIEYNKRI